jgi:O-antigen ligase
MSSNNNAISSGGQETQTYRLRSVFSALPLPEKIGLVGLYAFLFFAWESKSRAAAAFMVLLAGCLLDRRFWKTLPGSRVVWALAAVIGYIAVRGAVAVAENPDFLHFHLHEGWELILLAGFVFVGWQIRGDQRRLVAALMVGVLGFWIGRMEHFPLDETLAGIAWWRERQQFELPSAIGFGVFSAASLLGLLISLPRIWSFSSISWKRTLLVSAWLLLIVISLEGLILSQSRGPWIAFLLIGLVLLGANFRVLTRLGWLKATLLFAGVVAILASIVLMNYETMYARLQEERDTTTALLHGRLDEIRASGEEGEVKHMGIRYHMLLFGLEKAKQNPVFGLGPGITQPLLKRDWAYASRFSHLHNMYLEMLLRLGVVGMLLIAFVLILLVRDTWHAYSTRRIDRDIMLILFALLALPMLVGTVNFRMLDPDWRYYWFLIGGAMFGYSLLPAAPSMRNQQAAPEDPPVKPNP